MLGCGFINTLTVVMVIKGKERICPSAIFIFHLTASAHRVAQFGNYFLLGTANGAKGLSLVIHTAGIILRRQGVRMVVDKGLAHGGKVKLDATVVRHHQAGLAHHTFVAHIATGTMKLLGALIKWNLRGQLLGFQLFYPQCVRMRGPLRSSPYSPKILPLFVGKQLRQSFL